jgi:hypothetical protein
MIAQENTCLTHINQGSLVQAITGLTQVLSVGLRRPPAYPSRANTSSYPTMYEAELVHPLYQAATTHAYGVESVATQQMGNQNVATTFAYGKGTSTVETIDSPSNLNEKI